MAVDPLSAHECGNQRYLAIPWLDACLMARLPDKAGQPLKPMPAKDSWIAPLLGVTAVPAAAFKGDRNKAVWLPNKTVAQQWMQYTLDTKVIDTTPPPAPKNVKWTGRTLSWTAEADLESGISHFIIMAGSRPIATVPENPSNRFGRPLFQGLQYSDTPTVPLAKMEFTVKDTVTLAKNAYRVVAVNTAGLRSE